MPKVYDGQGYRSFSQEILEAASVEEVRQIEWPTNKAYTIVGADDGGSDGALYKFNLDSVAVDDGSTVLKPNNPAFDDAGRWLLIPLGGGSSGAGNFIGHGSPEGVVMADPGARYWDLDGQCNYIKETGAGDTGWIQSYCL